MQEEIQRYLLFARQFKPRITQASADYMVEEYKRLRQRDSSGGWTERGVVREGCGQRDSSGGWAERGVVRGTAQVGGQKEVWS